MHVGPWWVPPQRARASRTGSKDVRASRASCALDRESRTPGGATAPGNQCIPLNLVPVKIGCCSSSQCGCPCGECASIAGTDLSKFPVCDAERLTVHPQFGNRALRPELTSQRLALRRSSVHAQVFLRLHWGDGGSIAMTITGEILHCSRPALSCFVLVLPTVLAPKFANSRANSCHLLGFSTAVQTAEQSRFLINNTRVHLRFIILESTFWWSLAPWNHPTRTFNPDSPPLCMTKSPCLPQPSLLDARYLKLFDQAAGVRSWNQRATHKARCPPNTWWRDCQELQKGPSSLCLFVPLSLCLPVSLSLSLSLSLCLCLSRCLSLSLFLSLSLSLCLSHHVGCSTGCIRPWLSAKHSDDNESFIHTHTHIYIYIYSRSCPLRVDCGSI